MMISTSWATWASRLSPFLGLILLCTVPPCVDPQRPRHTALKVNLKDSLKLINILIRRPLGPKTFRQECRLLNATEFERITDVVNQAKMDTRLRPNVYDAFAHLHANPEVNMGAHRGAGFLPYHRVLVHLYEKMLRLYDPTLSMCYWDSTHETNDMSASVSWSSAFYGNHNGHVESGFAARWLTPLGPLIRAGGKIGRPFTHKDIELVLRKERLGEISLPGGDIESNVEQQHNYVHTYVGGLMGKVETASYDPIFWFHHTFIDCIYEWFRQSQRQNGINPARDWPAEYGKPAHSPFAAMRLGSLRMIDGANDFFPNRTFVCQDRIPDCGSDEQCGAHMRCNSLTGRCVSDTLAVASPQPSHIHDLGSLLGGQDMVSKLNGLLLTIRPTLGFNQLFKMPRLSSFSLFSDNSNTI